jgi:hypothetical protein
VCDDIFDGPLTGHATLIHTFRSNLSEQSLPLLILFMQPIQKIRFIHKTHLLENGTFYDHCLTPNVTSGKHGFCLGAEKKLEATLRKMLDPKRAPQAKRSSLRQMCALLANPIMQDTLFKTA